MNTVIKTPWAKRVFDIVVSTILLLLLSPFFGAIFILLFLEHFIRDQKIVSPLYRDIRLSEGKEFGLYKFNIFKHSVIRQMNENNIFINTKSLELNGDIVWMGYILRQIYFDEFPQLINVLFGNMSLVGPRPVNREGFKVRLQQGDTTKPRMRAGMTGAFQATKGESKSDMELDRAYLEYVESHSPVQVVLHDIRILLKTVRVILRAKGE